MHSPFDLVTLALESPRTAYAIIWKSDAFRSILFKDLVEFMGDMEFSTGDREREIRFPNGSVIYLLIKSELIKIRGLELSEVIIYPELEFTQEEWDQVRSQVRG